VTDIWMAWPEDLRVRAQILIDLALEEDLGAGDLTARYFRSEARRLSARLVAREAGVLAGLPVFFRAFACAQALSEGRKLNAADGLDGNGLERREEKADGETFKIGQVLARFSAPAAALHGAERSALNFLQRLCGVASATAAAVAASCGPAVYDTRKTTPGYRLLEKYAVRMGGGVNHRQGLFDAVLVKDNHKDALGGIAAVMKRVAMLPPGPPVIVEVDNLAELAQVLDSPAAGRLSRVLLDNFPPEAVERAVALRASRGGGPAFEVSGRLGAEELRDPRYQGVEAASLGRITHSARALDLALEVEAP